MYAPKALDFNASMVPVIFISLYLPFFGYFFFVLTLNTFNFSLFLELDTYFFIVLFFFEDLEILQEYYEQSANLNFTTISI